MIYIAAKNFQSAEVLAKVQKLEKTQWEHLSDISKLQKATDVDSVYFTDDWTEMKDHLQVLNKINSINMKMDTR
jgi:hypothetical protein